MSSKFDGLVLPKPQDVSDTFTQDLLSFLQKLLQTLKTPRGLELTGDEEITFGRVAKMLWETADANANALLLALPDGGAVDVPVLIIGLGSNIRDVDLGKFDGQTSPMLALIDAGGTKRVTLRHNGTNAVLYSSSGDIILHPVGNDVKPNADNDVSLGTATLQWKDIRFAGTIYAGGSAGVSGSFTTTDGKTVTVTKGIITGIV